MMMRLIVPFFVLVSSFAAAAESPCVASYRAAYNRYSLDSATNPKLTAVRNFLGAGQEDASVIFTFYIDTINNIAHESQEIDQLVADTGGSQTEIYDRIVGGMESGALCTSDGKTKSLAQIASDLR